MEECFLKTPFWYVIGMTYSCILATFQSKRLRYCLVILDLENPFSDSVNMILVF